MDGLAVKQDITAEAKRILMPAMKGFCKQARIKSEMEVWIEDKAMCYRVNDGIDEAEAIEKATKDYRAK
jgi:molybdopterin biosynthesis enzyme MoaB